MIIIHIAIAVLSLIFAVAGLIRPSIGQIKIVGATTIATLATGVVLIAQGANVLHMCLSGLLFTSLTVTAMSVSLRMLHRQQVTVHVR